MKKKIFVIVAVTTLLLIGVVIATNVEHPIEKNQYMKDNFISMGSGNKHQRERNRNEYQIDNLSELTGILENIEDSFYMDNIELLFGPDEKITRKASPFDYDGDEVIETVYNEINGLKGEFLYIKGHFIDENHFIVFEINDLPIGRPPHHPHHHENEKPLMNDHGLIDS